MPPPCAVVVVFLSLMGGGDVFVVLLPAIVGLACSAIAIGGPFILVAPSVLGHYYPYRSRVCFHVTRARRPAPLPVLEARAAGLFHSSLPSMAACASFTVA